MSLSLVQAGFEIPILLIALLIALYTLRLQQAQSYSAARTR